MNGERLLLQYKAARQRQYPTRYRAVTSRLNTDFWITTSNLSNSLYLGSYGRNTTIKGFSDLDMTFRLPYSITVDAALTDRVRLTIPPFPTGGSSIVAGEVALWHLQRVKRPLMLRSDNVPSTSRASYRG